jgi:putative hydrolase of the HAD superfamily
MTDGGWTDHWILHLCLSFGHGAELHARPPEHAPGPYFLLWLGYYVGMTESAPKSPSKLRFIFFDVGNTLLFPNRARVLTPLPPEKHPTLKGWQAIERRSKLEFDQVMTDGKVDHSFWWIFHTHLLEEVGDSSDSLRDQLIRNTQQSANWDQILPGTREALEGIRHRFKIAIISNSDGKIDEVLGRCGIADCFASITDSGIVGVEKPHPAIFAAALEKMKAEPAESLYVGDLYSVDYVGAHNAGMQAMLFDVAGAYRDREFPHVESLAELEAWLKCS